MHARKATPRTMPTPLSAHLDRLDALLDTLALGLVEARAELDAIRGLVPQEAETHG